jgi:sugar lactone lactonase YvrE
MRLPTSRLALLLALAALLIALGAPLRAAGSTVSPDDFPTPIMEGSTPGPTPRPSPPAPLHAQIYVSAASVAPGGAQGIVLTTSPHVSVRLDVRYARGHRPHVAHGATDGNGYWQTQWHIPRTVTGNAQITLTLTSGRRKLVTRRTFSVAKVGRVTKPRARATPRPVATPRPRPVATKRPTVTPHPGVHPKKTATPRPVTSLIPPGPGARWVGISLKNVQHPAGLAVAPGGKSSAPTILYTADAAAGRIVKFNAGGKVIGSWTYGSPSGSTGAHPALAVGGSGNVFLADPAGGTILKFSPSGKVLSAWPGFNDPRALAVDQQGNVYVAEYGAHSITKLSPGGRVLTRWDMHTVWSAGSVGSPVGVALDEPQGYVYAGSECFIAATCGHGAITNPSVDEVDWILEFSTSGAMEGIPREFWGGVGHSVDGTPQEGPSKESEPFVTIDAMTNDAAGNLYVAGYLWPLGGPKAWGVVRYSPLGYKSRLWDLPAAGPISAVAVDLRGVVYVTQSTRILKLTGKP